MSNLTIKQQSNYSGFPKAAELIEIEDAHALEASDRAIFNQLLQSAHDSGRLTEPDAEWEVSLAGLRRASRHDSNARIRESLRPHRKSGSDFLRVRLRSGAHDGRPCWISRTTDEDSPNATVQFGIPKRLRAVLARSNRWGRIRCEVAYAMTSKYAIALYEMVACGRGSTGAPRSCESMSSAIGWASHRAHTAGDNFMRIVIVPALLEVNGLSDVGAQIEMVRRHPRAPAHAVTFAWWRKAGDDFRAAMHERHRSKVGRMARLRGEVETKVRWGGAGSGVPRRERLKKHKVSLSTCILCYLEAFRGASSALRYFAKSRFRPSATMSSMFRPCSAASVLSWRRTSSGKWTVIALVPPREGWAALPAQRAALCGAAAMANPLRERAPRPLLRCYAMRLRAPRVSSCWLSFL